MRLARRALFAALTMLVLCAAASAQALRPETDPRNLSPAVGTGGPVAGPTGLFTVYDGQTIRRGEFTFSIAYSNFDRDPGNVDLTEVPLSFNVGLSDHLELFFNTTAWRGIHVNNPQNLSSFYLPNSQLKFPFLGSGPAIILAPSGPNVGTIAGTALFRPRFNQPFVQWPFVGGSAGNFGINAGIPQGNTGFPGFSATLGPPVGTANSGNFGPADNFPGIGSVVGGILPGIVLATTTLPPTLLNGAITVPATFTIAPSYLPDAPFINRLYGESSFTSFVVGAKWRWTGPRNPLGVGIIPFYRYYPDKADDFSGFNQLQRGASPGGDIGDFGLIFFLDARLSRSVNVSVNGGYILNSNPKGTFPSGEFTLLDRPDEFLSGIAFDFPVNKYFQPVLELRTTQYVGGRTPNAFENSPVDALAGVKIYPRRWMGFGFAYRYHINQQDRSMFEGTDFNTQVNQITNVNPIGPQPITVVPATTVGATVGGFPRGFIESDDANGFIGQFWIGRRNARTPEFLPNQPPTVTLSASSGTIVRPCPPGTRSRSGGCPGDYSSTVQLSANATDPDGDTLLYTYTTTGGRVTGDGANVSWDLTGVQPGTYTATVEVDDGCGCMAYSSTTVTVSECSDCIPPCPEISVSCPSDVQAGTPATVSVNLSGGDPNASVTYNWSVSAGTISSGQGTPSITIDTTGLGNQTVTATVEIGGLPPECDRTRSCSFSVLPIVTPPECRKFDEYADLRFNDEKARLDNFAIQLQQEPGSQGYYVIFGSCEGEADQRSARAVDYLVNNRQIDRSRITVVNGGCREQLTVELWICPTGAAAPTPSNSATVDPCPQCRRPTYGRRRARRRGGRRGYEE
ncbi:MAG TPA: hypothetical protein VJT09_19890 [Pyrinomonadaceae bacterium]|nr:hypothetical protein [Pyrinomonadaceae bacterium]